MNGYYLSKKTLTEYTISNCDTGEELVLDNIHSLKEFSRKHKVYGVGYINGEIQLDCKSEAMSSLDDLNYMTEVIFKLNSMDCGRKLLYLGRHRGYYLFKEGDSKEAISFTPEYLIEHQAASIEILKSNSKFGVPFKRYALQNVHSKYKFSCKWSEFEFYKLANKVRGSRVTVRYTGSKKIKCLNCDLVIRYDEFVELPFTRVDDAKRWITWEIERK